MSGLTIFMAFGIAITTIAGIYAAGIWEDRKGRKARAIHKQCATNIQRLEARLLLASGSVTKGHRQ